MYTNAIAMNYLHDSRVKTTMWGIFTAVSLVPLNQSGLWTHYGSFKTQTLVPPPLSLPAENICLLRRPLRCGPLGSAQLRPRLPRQRQSASLYASTKTEFIHSFERTKLRSTLGLWQPHSPPVWKTPIVPTLCVRLSESCSPCSVSPFVTISRKPLCGSDLCVSTYVTSNELLHSCLLRCLHPPLECKLCQERDVVCLCHQRTERAKIFFLMLGLLVVNMFLCEKPGKLLCSLQYCTIIRGSPAQHKVFAH